MKKFEEFLKQGVVKKQFPDKPRAQDLIIESDKTFKSVIEVVNKIGINNINANTIIKESYDAIMGLIRAKMLLEGFSCSGQGAHEAEVSYLKELNFSEEEIHFTDRLRYFRNGIMYYGKGFDTEYAKKVITFLKKLYPNLVKILGY